jgi:hypothetical protein
LEEAVPVESETVFNFAVLTPSPQYEQPRRSWHLPAACSARSALEVSQVAGRNTTEEPSATSSLFRSRGLAEIGGVEAIAEASESEDESEHERTPLGAEPLSLDEEELAEPEAPLGFPLVTPSPAYHAEASARYASLRSGQQLPHPHGKVGFPAGVRFENFPCALQQSSFGFAHQPRSAAVGGA